MLRSSDAVFAGGAFRVCGYRGGTPASACHSDAAGAQRGVGAGGQVEGHPRKISERRRPLARPVRGAGARCGAGQKARARRATTRGADGREVSGASRGF